MIFVNAVERDLKCKLIEKIKSEAVIFNWLETKIDVLNDSHKERADELRKILIRKEIELHEKVNKLSIPQLLEKLEGKIKC
jgi:hypothetical protein